MSVTIERQDTLAHNLTRPILPPEQTHREMRVFLLKRIPGLRRPARPEEWLRQADQLRQRVLTEVVLRGVPKSWRGEAVEVVWGDVLETGAGYRIRKLRYQALPGLWIPALLYEPLQLQASVPAVLNLNGHVGPPGKAIDYKQLRCINLAKRGLLALNPEWFFFGELEGEGYRHNRSVYLDLCGVAGVAVFFLAMQRALEVLLAHPHTDPERVAVTGLSGGGWQTIVLSALDTRVGLAAPNAGYIGLDVRVDCREDVGDSEQNPTDLATMADYPTLTAMVAPRPALLLYNQEDDCCFRAGRAKPSVYDPVRPLYEELGRGDRFLFHINVDPGTHNYDVDNRQQFYRFLNRHFLPPEQRCDDEILSLDEVRTEEELSVGLPADNADFISLGRALAGNLPCRRWPEGNRKGFITWQQESRCRLQAILRYEPLEVTAARPAAGADQDPSWQRLLLDLGGYWTLPAVVCQPAGEAQGTMLITADGGRGAAAPMVAEALEKGLRVVVLDLLLQGECRSEKMSEAQFDMSARAAGSRTLGVQVAQLAAIARWAARDRSQSVALMGCGPVAALIAITAGALEEEVIKEVVAVQALASLKLLIENQTLYEDSPSLFCFGLLEAFDIRELAGMVVPRPVTLFQTQGDPGRVERELGPLQELYALILNSHLSPKSPGHIRG